MPSLYLFVLSFSFTFGMVFLKSLQVRNMVSGQYMWMFVLSMIIGATEVLVPQVSVKGGPWLMISGSLGAGFGIVIAVKGHEYLGKLKNKPCKRSIPKSPRKYRRPK